MSRTIISSLFLALLTLSIGCGSVSNSPSPTPTPTPVASPTPTQSAASDSYLTTVFLQQGRVPTTVGTLTLDTTTNNGAGTIQFKGLTAPSSTLILQFCPYPQANPNLPNCSNVASLTADASGNANASFTLALKGSISGEFQLVQTNGALLGATGTDTAGASFHSALLPAATITGGIQQTTGSAPGSGTVVMNGTDATIALTGTTPNHTFTTAVCSLFPTGPAPCTALANVTTDMNGNATADVGAVQRDSSSVFRVSDADGVEFVTAFRVQ